MLDDALVTLVVLLANKYVTKRQTVFLILLHN
jgi:hypothetical protein